MRSEASSRYRLIRNVSTAFAVIAAVLLSGAITVATVATVAEARQSKSPLLYKGNGYKYKPGLMYGWDPDGFGKPLRYLGKTHVSDPPGSAIKWRSWRKNRAVGVGLARSSGCGTGGMEGKCELGYPWNGTRLKVVAWRRKSGHFTRMKIFTPISQKSSRYYGLVLAFRGPFVPDRTVSWKTVRTIRG